MRDLKYLFAYTIPVSAYLSFMSFGAGTYAAVIYAFIIIYYSECMNIYLQIHNKFYA